MPLSEFTMAISGRSGVDGGDIGFDLGLLITGQALDLGVEVADTVIKVNAELTYYRGVLFDQRPYKRP